MNNTITITQFFGEPLVESKKTAKLFKDKAIAMSKRFSDSLIKLQEPVSEKVVEKPQVTRDYKAILPNLNLTCYEFNETVIPTGARKLKVNPVVSNSAKEMYNACKIAPVKVKEEPVLQQENEFFFNSQSAPTLPKAEPVKEPTQPVSTRVSRLETMPPVASTESFINEPATNNVVHENIVHENQNSSISVDDYLQQTAPKDDYVIVQLSETNEKLKDEIVKSQTYAERLEQQLNELKTMKEQKISALEEERLGYTATLDGLTEKIRNLQEAINKEKQTLGR